MAKQFKVQLWTSVSQNVGHMQIESQGKDSFQFSLSSSMAGDSKLNDEDWALELCLSLNSVTSHLGGWPWATYLTTCISVSSSGK